MAIEHQYTVLCDYLMNHDGRLAMVGTFTNVSLASIPSKLPRLCIAVCFAGDEGDAFRVSLHDPDDEELLELGNAVIPALEDDERIRLAQVTSSLIGFDFHKEGVYQVVLWDGDGNAVHRSRFSAFLEQGEENGDSTDES
jgi:hypothetical protein